MTINGVMKRLLWFAGEQYSLFFYLRRNAKAGPPKVLGKFGPGQLGPIQSNTDMLQGPTVHGSISLEPKIRALRGEVPPKI